MRANLAIPINYQTMPLLSRIGIVSPDSSSRAPKFVRISVPEPPAFTYSGGWDGYSSAPLRQTSHSSAACTRRAVSRGRRCAPPAGRNRASRRCEQLFPTGNVQQGVNETGETLRIGNAAQRRLGVRVRLAEPPPAELKEVAQHAFDLAFLDDRLRSKAESRLDCNSRCRSQGGSSQTRSTRSAAAVTVAKSASMT